MKEWANRQQLWILMGPLFFVVAICAYFAKSPIDDKLWTIGFIASIGLSFLISTLSFRELSLSGKQQEEEYTQLQMRNKELELGLREAQRFAVSEKEAASLKVEELKESSQELEEKCQAYIDTALLKEREVKTLTQDLTEAKQHIARLETASQNLLENQAQLDELNHLRTELHELQNINKELREQTQDANYRELRKQFDEKSQLLHETRKELFLAQEKVALIEREREEENHSRSPEVIDLEKALAALTDEREDALTQISTLEEIISDLNSKF